MMTGQRGPALPGRKTKVFRVMAGSADIFDLLNSVASG
jgi:hypothetical protein